MIYFMNNLNSEGRPLLDKKIFCKKCGFTSKTEQGIRVHMAVHRVGPDSYHQKGDLYKSKRWTYET